MPDGGYPPDGQLFGAERFVLYLPEASDTLRDLDGAERTRIRSQIEQFLDSPGGTFAKHPGAYVSHVRELKQNVRAFCTWCQNRHCDAELCVVHDIYRKTNESSYFRFLDDYDEMGESYATTFSELEGDQLENWLRETAEEDDQLQLVRDE